MLKSLFHTQRPWVPDAFWVSRRLLSCNAEAPARGCESPSVHVGGSGHGGDGRRWAVSAALLCKGDQLPAPARALLLFGQCLNIAGGRERALPGCPWIPHPSSPLLGTSFPWAAALSCGGFASLCPSAKRAGPPAAPLSCCCRKQRLVLPIRL